MKPNHGVPLLIMHALQLWPFSGFDKNIKCHNKINDRTLQYSILLKFKSCTLDFRLKIMQILVDLLPQNNPSSTYPPQNPCTI